MGCHMNLPEHRETYGPGGGGLQDAYLDLGCRFKKRFARLVEELVEKVQAKESEIQLLSESLMSQAKVKELLVAAQLDADAQAVELSELKRQFAEDAAAAFESLVPVDVMDLGVGKQRYGLLLNEAGGIIDDLMLDRKSVV